MSVAKRPLTPPVSDNLSDNLSDELSEEMEYRDPIKRSICAVGRRRKARRPRFTDRENEVLLNALHSHGKRLLNTDVGDQSYRSEAWRQIVGDVNAVGGHHRKYEAVRRRASDMIHAARLRARTLARSANRTGGPQMGVPLTENEMFLLSLRDTEVDVFLEGRVESGTGPVFAAPSRPIQPEGISQVTVVQVHDAGTPPSISTVLPAEEAESDSTITGVEATPSEDGEVMTDHEPIDRSIRDVGHRRTVRRPRFTDRENEVLLNALLSHGRRLLDTDVSDHSYRSEAWRQIVGDVNAVGCEHRDYEVVRRRACSIIHAAQLRARTLARSAKWTGGGSQTGVQLTENEMFLLSLRDTEANVLLEGLVESGTRPISAAPCRPIQPEGVPQVTVVQVHRAGTPPSISTVLPAEEAESDSTIIGVEATPSEAGEPCTRMENELSDMSFSSWEEFCSFFDSWCEKSKVLFNKIKGVPLSKWTGTGNPPSPEQVEVLRYRTVLLVCKYYRARGGYLQTNTGDYRPGCPARIIVKLDPVQNKLIVVTAELEHNHEICPIEFAKCFRKNRFVGETDSTLLLRVTNETSKQFLNLRDVHKLQNYCRNQDANVLDILKAIEELLVDDEGVKVRLVFVEGQVIVKGFVFITSCMKRLCDRFPRVLYFDKMTYLSDEFDLYFILCEDANGRGRECLYCIARKDTEDIFRFILVSLVQSVPRIKTRVNCLILGNINEDLSIIQTVLPNAKVQFCRTQVLESLYNKAIEIEGVFQDNIWDFFCKLANSWSPVSYSRNLREMNSMFSKEFIEYFQDTWDTRKEMWVESWAFERNKGSTFSRFVRAHQQMLASELGSYHTMAEYIGRLHQLQSLKTETTDLEEDKIQPRFREVCSYDLASLIEEEIGLGKNGCYRMKVVGDGFVLNDGTAEYTVNKEQNSCSCTIYTSTLLPCRHIFATRLWTGETICFSEIHKHKTV